MRIITILIVLGFMDKIQNHFRIFCNTQTLQYYRENLFLDPLSLLLSVIFQKGSLFIAPQLVSPFKIIFVVKLSMRNSSSISITLPSNTDIKHLHQSIEVHIYGITYNTGQSNIDFMIYLSGQNIKGVQYTTL